MRWRKYPPISLELCFIISMLTSFTFSGELNEIFQRLQSQVPFWYHAFKLLIVLIAGPWTTTTTTIHFGLSSKTCTHVINCQEGPVTHVLMLTRILTRCATHNSTNVWVGCTWTRTTTPFGKQCVKYYPVALH